MQAVLIGKQDSTMLSPVKLSGEDGFSEAWLQKVLFENSSLLGAADLSGGLDPILPISRELPLRGASSKVFLDIFAVRRSGRPVLVECKLWRNPQARREVIGQILEYAALMSGLTYSDLEAQLKASNAISAGGLYPHVAERDDNPIEEKNFIDSMSQCLARGDFDLVIAGDGIRSDVVSVVELLEHSMSGGSSLSLVEINVWRRGEENFVIATPPLRVERRSYSPRAILVGDEEEISEETPAKTHVRDPEKQEKNRIFWTAIIEDCDFDHPDQPAPKRLNVNSIRVPFPEPAGWVTCYRIASSRKRMGIFMHLSGHDGRRVFEELERRQAEFTEEFPGLKFTADDEHYKDGKPTIYITQEIDITDDATIDQQKMWFKTNINRWVNIFRPALTAANR